MKTLKIKNIVNAAACAVHCSLQHPSAKPGQIGDVRTVEIIDIPDGIPDYKVLRAWEQTADVSYLGREDLTYSRHTFRFSEIGGGRILRA